MLTRPSFPLLVLSVFFLSGLTSVVRGQTALPQTAPLSENGDFASTMVDGIDRFLLRKIDQAAASRSQQWNDDFTGPAAFQKSIDLHRTELARILGAGDDRVKFDSPELMTTVAQPALIVETKTYQVFAIRWPVLAHPAPTSRNLVTVHGEGLLLQPRTPAFASVVAIPDADQTPEQICGLQKGVPTESQFAARLAEAGCRVVVPMLISRHAEPRNGRSTLSNREYIYRSAFELGRHLLGYEIQKVRAIVDWFKDSPDSRVGVIGYGEGGLLAMYTAAIDDRIDATLISGAFAPRESCWTEPLERNLFGLLKRFGAAETAAMILPRRLVIEPSSWPGVQISSNGAGPGQLQTPSEAEFNGEIQRLNVIADRIPAATGTTEPVVTAPAKNFCGTDSLQAFYRSLIERPLPDSPSAGTKDERSEVAVNEDQIAARQQRQMEELDRHNQALLAESSFVRDEFFKGLDRSSVDAYSKSVESYRRIFQDEVVGNLNEPLLPFNARTRATWTNDRWTGYEVVLDVFPDVIAYGVLLLPKDMKPGEKRPVVVCQHGLEGRPTDTFLDDHRAYHDFAAKLCERGFITFAPQNPYIFQDRFRTLQRKANAIGCTLFSVIVPQHQQIVNWLKTLPQVDGDRIGFYGLSYGGKSAMRIPALVTDYCLSICSADFNEWVLKNASTRHPFSYVWTGEYEIFEWNLGSTFNYAEMAALICPRPFMVERGHFDGVGTDEWVAHEFAKVRHLYAARLGIGDRAEIEWFVGPHTINGQATFSFLHRHLQWPEKPADVE